MSSFVGIPLGTTLVAIISVLVVFGSLLAGLAIICWTVVRLLTGGRTKSVSDEESRIIQELYHGFERMERRVEALETLLLDQDAKGSRS